MMQALQDRVGERAGEAAWLYECWNEAAEELRRCFPDRVESDDKRYDIHGTDQWKWALYRLNFAVKGRDRNSAAVEVDPFDDIVRVIFFHEEVESQKELFEELARNIRHSTWDHRIEPQGPVDFPRTDGVGHCPEVKFEFDSRESWVKHSGSMVLVAVKVYADAEPGVPEG